MLAAAKATFGHAEPAAGLVGMLQAAQGLQHCLQAPVLHLVTPNPMVDAALRDTLRVGIPRQGAPLALPPTCVGTSAFAFQVANSVSLCFLDIVQPFVLCQSCIQHIPHNDHNTT